MIPGALTEAEFRANASKYIDGHEVICYCTMGYRSGNFCNLLIQEGFNAYNMAVRACSCCCCLPASQLALTCSPVSRARSWPGVSAACP